MPKAIWNNTVIAESDDTIIIEDNHYFPPVSVEQTYLKAANTQSTCPWKGQAHYFNLEVNGQVMAEAAWHYPNPSDAASQIKEYVAFGNDVHIDP